MSRNAAQGIVCLEKQTGFGPLRSSLGLLPKLGGVVNGAAFFLACVFIEW